MKPLGELELMTQRVKQLEERLDELEQMLLELNGRPGGFSIIEHELLARHLTKGDPNAYVRQ